MFASPTPKYRIRRSADPRARQLHPETNFGDSFESRFRKGQGKQLRRRADAPNARHARHPSALAAPAEAGAVSAFVEADVNYVELPPIDSWNIPLRCYKCNEVHEQNVKNFTIGNVIFCPHCHKSTFVRDNLNYHIRTLLKDSYDQWENGNANSSTARARAGGIHRTARQGRRRI